LFLRLRDRLGEYGVLIEQLALGKTIRQLGLDSLDIVELIMELEEECEITIPENEAERIKTIADAIRYIAEELRRRKEQP
jgi:acyl carrier protein